jgi:phenylpropionate dioxygenase-like ring-hydroxylating dioxygenase large terminal subunit
MTVFPSTTPLLSSAPSPVQHDKETLEKNFYDELTDMRKAWYPIMPVSEVPNRTPISFSLLEDPLVIYRNPETQKIVIFADKCAHRSAPLSVGRIMDGKLECRYHGWQFDVNGKCTKIPSLMEGRSIPANAKLQKYPVHEANGWVWVWPGDPADAEKKEKPKFYHPWEDYQQKPRVGYIDLDIDHCLLLENFLDPAHLPFTHDSTISKRSDATPIKMTCEYTEFGIKGVTEYPLRPDMINTEFQYRPPINISLKFFDSSKPDLKMDQTFYCVPTKKGHCRFVWLQRFSFLKFLESFWLTRWILDWSFPRYNLKVVMEDYAMLTGQQKRLAYGANAMNSPVQADIMIKTYRNWWRKAMKRNPWFTGYSADIEDIVLSHPCVDKKN